MNTEDVEIRHFHRETLMVSLPCGESFFIELHGDRKAFDVVGEDGEYAQTNVTVSSLPHIVALFKEALEKWGDE